MTTRTYHVSPEEMERFKKVISEDEESSLMDTGNGMTYILTHKTALGKVELLCAYSAPTHDLSVGIKKKPLPIREKTIFEHIEHLMGRDV